MKTTTRTILFLLFTGFSICSLGQTPVLNSYPAASAVILLDFDGHLVTGTPWNYAGDINCSASGLTSEQITEVFNRVAEDFRPFNINITTEEAKYAAAPINRRMRVIITTSHEWYGTGAGGVAYINCFTWGNDTPAFVFSALFGFNIKNIAEASAHEAGHTLGLRHQSTYNSSCVKTSDYNWGQGSGEIGWAPIMGAGYYQNLTLWHNGPNSLGCTNYQTDLSIITNATNGFGFRTDDHNNNYAAATVAAFNGAGQFSINGVIEETSDEDLFSFTVSALGTFTLDAVPYNVGTGNSGSDLDLNIDLLDQTHTVVGTYNPGTQLNSVIDTTLSAGTYYLRVDGKGNMYAPEYGSLGSYSLLGTFTEGIILPLKELELKGNSEKNEHSLFWVVNSKEKIIAQKLERSSDGNYFLPIATPDKDTRNYSYTYLPQTPVQYRLIVEFANGKKSYSNVITLRPETIFKPKLNGNLITGKQLNVSCPEDFEYSIIDHTGKAITKGRIIKGSSSVEAGFLAAGIYIIRFTNGKGQWSEKFVKK